MGQEPVFHLNAQRDDFLGNGVLGRYVLLPGSDGRAEEIASRLEDSTVKTSERRLNCYFGKFRYEKDCIDLAVVSTGMGCPSMDIVLSELIALGARRFLRLGTAGSLQPNKVKFGDFVIAHSAVRDESTSRNYAPLEFPAVADLGIVTILQQVLAEEKSVQFHVGTVHCKDSLFAREFRAGPLHLENDRYMEILSQCGVLASEMEAAQLFIRTQIEAARLARLEEGNIGIKAGALLAIIGEKQPFESRDKGAVTQVLIELGLRAVARWCVRERSLQQETVGLVGKN